MWSWLFLAQQQRLAEQDQQKHPPHGMPQLDPPLGIFPPGLVSDVISGLCSAARRGRRKLKVDSAASTLTTKCSGGPRPEDAGVPCGGDAVKAGFAGFGKLQKLAARQSFVQPGLARRQCHSTRSHQAEAARRGSGQSASRFRLSEAAPVTGGEPSAAAGQKAG